MSDEDFNDALIEYTAEIVCSYVTKNSIPRDQLGELIATVHGALSDLRKINPSRKGPTQPAIPIKKSVTRDFIICLEDGKKFKSLKRHLMSTYGMTPDEYREKWNLPSDYPMVAPSYSERRSELANAIGLGHKDDATKH